MSNYKVVSELKRHGELIDIPDDASNVSVQPLGRNGVVRVTYLTRVHELQFDEEPRQLGYVD